MGLPGVAGLPGPRGQVGEVGEVGFRGTAGFRHLESITFLYRDFGLQEKCKDKLFKLSIWLRDNPRAQIALDGHTGGADDSPFNLADQRVATVRAELMRLGVAPDRIQAGAFGRKGPICTTTTETCLEQNRRVEILGVRP